jgi:membrane protease subunit (stomatin/prohibitin family)
MVLRDFVKNYEDMSDDNGYQFKFYCDICGDGFMTAYRQAPFAKTRSLLGAATNIGNIGGSILGRGGGMFGGAKGAADSMHDAKWREAKEKALDDAVAEAKAHFTKCPSCAKYVDATCWNEQVLMCVECAPRQAVVVQKAKAQAFVQKAGEAMQSKDMSAEIAAAEEVRIICPNCKKPTTSGKFCEACGAPLEKQACPNCAASNSLTARFCNNCGGKLR